MNGAANEKWYDESVAPVLKDLGDKCLARGASLVAVVEYQSGHRGRTVALSDASLEMRLLDFCAQAGTNVDAYFIAVVRYCRAEGIPTDGSVVMNCLNVNAPSELKG